MFRAFVIGLLVASCNNQSPPSGAQTSARTIATPTSTSTATPLAVVAKDIDRVEARLKAKASEIEAAFASSDCQTIALKRTAVEKRESYNPPIVSDLMWDELTVKHSRLAEYDRRAQQLGCGLHDCTTFTDITLVDSPSQTVNGTTSKDTQAACYRVRNPYGDQVLSVKVNAKVDGQGDIGIEAENGIVTNYSGIVTNNNETVTLEAAPVAAFAVRSMEMGNDGAEPEAGWQAVPFTLTMTPVLRQQAVTVTPTGTANVE